jgi:hypothetical protein
MYNDHTGDSEHNDEGASEDDDGSFVLCLQDKVVAEVACFDSAVNTEKYSDEYKYA